MSTIDKIFELARSNGISNAELAKKLNLNPQAITDWKSGKSRSYNKYLYQIAAFLDTTPEYLKGESKSPRRIKKIPVLGNVAAGVPIEAIEEWDDWEEIDEDQYPAGEYIALRIHGDSMEPKFSEGDVVIVQYGNPCESGDIAIVMVNGSEATCKKIKFMPEGIFLISLNPEYEPMFFSAKEVVELPVRVLGKVVELRAKF